MSMQPAVSYIPYATSSKEQTSDFITFAKFEEGDSLSENRDDTESTNEFDYYSTLSSLISEE